MDGSMKKKKTGVDFPDERNEKKNERLLIQFFPVRFNRKERNKKKIKLVICSRYDCSDAEGGSREVYNPLLISF